MQTMPTAAPKQPADRKIRTMLANHTISETDPVYRSILRIKTRLMDAVPANPFALFAGPMLACRWAVTSGHPLIPTAGTDGETVVFDREFMQSLTEPERAFVVLHEFMHAIFLHFDVYRPLSLRYGMQANVAMDIFINLWLMRIARDCRHIQIEPPQKMVDWMQEIDAERYEGFDTPSILRDLIKRFPPPPQGGGGGGGGGGAEGDEVEGDGDPGMPGDGQFDYHDWSADPDALDKMRERIETASRQAGLLAGQLGLDVPREFDELVKVKVDWRQQLADFVTSLKRGDGFGMWSRPDRRFLSQGIHLPTYMDDSTDEAVVAIDTSGSIGGPELTMAISHLVNIARGIGLNRLHIIYWDDEVASHETWDRIDETLASKTRPAGGGGTRPSCITDFLAANTHKIKDPAFAVVFTDGWVGADWGGSWPCPVLWGIINNRSAIASQGVTIHID